MMEPTLNLIGRKALNGIANIALDLDVQMHVDWPEEPMIIAANHPTTADPFYLIGIVPKRMSLLITEMAFRTPGGGLMRKAGHIPVLASGGRPAFDEAVARLGAGENIGVFVEGALSPRDGGLQPARTGAARMALTAGVPILPVGIALERERINYVETEIDEFSQEARWYLRGPYSVTVGRPMHLRGDINDWDHVRRLSQDVLERIGALATESTRRLQRKGVPVETGTFARVAVG